MDDDEIRTLYCKLEGSDERKDYLRGGRCVRLAGVDQTAWTPEVLEPNATAYIVDIDVWEWYRARGAYWPDYEDLPSEDFTGWIKVRFRVSSGRSYFYHAFSDSRTDPSWFTPIEISFVPGGPPLPVYPERRVALLGSTSLQSTFELSAFHVGQGMASLISDGNHGVLVDAGAGGPVTRATYSSLGRNELRNKVLTLKTLDFVLSHADADHWRILHWDSQIRAKIRTFYVPARVSSVLFNDPAISRKVQWVGSASVQLGASWLHLLRTVPAISDRNGEALVARFQKGQAFALLPGDYVYQRMNGDGDLKIRALGTQSYSAVVVPHHGDDASSVTVFRAAVGGKAFFSAGTHRRYKHPRPASISAHLVAGYSNIVDNTQPEILAVFLL